MFFMAKKNMKGIGGWLLFFLVVFFLSASRAFLNMLKVPLYNFFVTYFGLDMPGIARAYQIVLIVTSCILFFGYLMSAIAILKKMKVGKSGAIATTWAGFGFAIILGIMSFFNLNTATVVYAETVRIATIFFWLETGFIWLFHLAWAILVTVYFTKSERVKNTLNI